MSIEVINVPVENQHISSSLMEKILSVNNNTLVDMLFNIYKTEATGKGMKNVTVNNKGEMTFLPKGKDCIANTHTFPPTWKSDNRQSGSYGKVLRKLLVENGVEPKLIKASELEAIVNSLKARYTVEGEFAIVSGDDITKYYLGENYDYEFNIGSLGSSCMRHEGACQRATEFYANNENCQMVILRSPDPDEDLIRGRALLWTDKEGRKFLDRIYANDYITEAFKMLARTNGWYRKSCQDPCFPTWIGPDDKVCEIKARISVDTDFKPIPYMDTFCCWDDGSIMAYDDGDYEIYAQTEPESQECEDNEDRVYDEANDCYIDRDEAVYLGYRDVHTHVDNATQCSIDGEWYLYEHCVCTNRYVMVYEGSDEITYVDSENMWYHKEDTRYCDFNNDYYPEDEVMWVEDLDMDVRIVDVDEAYDLAGWVLDEDSEWVEELPVTNNED
jgi:hypothetical protein